MPSPARLERFHLVLLFSFFAALLWSGIRPHDYFTWILEVAPALIALVVLVVTFRRFPLSKLTYGLIWFHALILVVGGHYTYARVPLFDWIRDMLGQGRNNYDKLGHLAQGFIPAIVARELLLRTSPLRPGKWLNALIVLSVLGISAFYELVEWWVAVLSGTAGDSFLGTQGYVWDTQTDMFMAFLGAILALLLLSRTHDAVLYKNLTK